MDYSNMTKKMKHFNDMISHVNWNEVLTTLGMRRSKKDYLPWILGGLAAGAAVGAGIAWYFTGRQCCSCCAPGACPEECCTWEEEQEMSSPTEEKA